MKKSSREYELWQYLFWDRHGLGWNLNLSYAIAQFFHFIITMFSLNYILTGQFTRVAHQRTSEEVVIGLILWIIYAWVTWKIHGHWFKM